MNHAVLAEYEAPPLGTQPDSGWERTRLLWTGWDGSEWDLTDEAGGVFVKRGGVRGLLGMPKPKHYRDDSPAKHGSYWRGLIYEARKPHLTIHTFNDEGTVGWAQRQRAWWDSLHPEYEGTLTCEVPGISKRYIDLRLEGDNDWAPDLDPNFFGWADFDIDLQADAPLWRGEPVPGKWQAPSGLPFHGGKTPGAPILNLGSGQSLASAGISNPGDVEGWGVWKASGPFTSARIGIDGHYTTIPFALGPGESVTIDMNPDQQTAFRESGEDVFELLGETDFRHIPARRNADLDLVIVGGAGQIEVEFTPLYLRAM